MEREIRVAGFIPTSASDGPGIRSVLFLQGCSRHCPGCHNKPLQNASGGQCVLCSKLADDMRIMCRNRKLTISGGEPLEQPEALLVLLEKLAKEHFELCLYTGCEAKQVPQKIMRYLHYLKTGPFVETAQYPPKPFVGSNNQIFYQVEHGKDGTIWLTEI